MKLEVVDDRDARLVCVSGRKLKVGWEVMSVGVRANVCVCV